MEIVIKIDEEDYKIMKHNIAVNNPLCPLSQEEMVSKVANGTPLPKGHGRLFDERDIVNGNYEVIGNRIYELEPIIEADKESEDD